MRARIWRLHSWLGLFSGLGLLVIGLTGSLLVFHEELSAVIWPERFVVTPRHEGRLGLDTLLKKAEDQLTEYEITGWHLQTERPDRADDLYVIRRGTNVWLTATLDPYTGRLLTTPHSMETTLHGWLVKLHSEFLLGTTGVAFAGALAVILCFLGLSGLWLYRGFWKALLTLRLQRGSRILFSDTHKFVGVISVPFNLILGFTGAYWNITHTYEHVTQAEVEQPVIESRLYPATLSLEAVVHDAPLRLTGFRTGFISLPSVPAAPAVLLWGAVEPRGALHTRFGTILTYDPLTGEHRATNDLRQATRWRRITDTFEPLHFGAFGGLGVKILWTLGGLTPGILGVTGFMISRLRSRNATSHSSRPGRPEGAFDVIST
jgi:uncharacterized iron-regulated membrane protein